MSEKVTRVPLAVVRARAAHMPEGYYKLCLSNGKVEGDELVLTYQAFEEIAAQYTMNLQDRGCPGCGG
jgi:hypothetical protein